MLLKASLTSLQVNYGESHRRMKRSTAITLVLLGATGAGLTLCHDDSGDRSGRLFASAADCEAGGVDADLCRAAFAQSQEEHWKTAPKFGTAADCEAQFGEANCVARPSTMVDGGSWFVPAMLGFMIGRGMAGTPAPGMVDPCADPRMAAAASCGRGTTGGTGSTGFRSGYYSQPVYRDTANMVYSAGETVARAGDGFSSAPRRVAGTPGTPPTKSSGGYSVPTVSRGGSFTHAGSSGSVSRGGFGSSGAHASS